VTVRKDGKSCTMLWFNDVENERRKIVGATHYQCWLRGLREYQRDELEGVKTEIETETVTPVTDKPCTAVLSLGADGLKIIQNVEE